MGGAGRVHRPGSCRSGFFVGPDGPLRALLPWEYGLRDRSDTHSHDTALPNHASTHGNPHHQAHRHLHTTAHPTNAPDGQDAGASHRDVPPDRGDAYNEARCGSHRIIDPAPLPTTDTNDDAITGIHRNTHPNFTTADTHAETDKGTVAHSDGHPAADGDKHYSNRTPLADTHPSGHPWRAIRVAPC
jgi:hypothetical protein